MKHRLLSGVLALALVSLAPALSYAGSLTANDALEQLKSLSGTWTGTPEGEGEEAEAEAEAAGGVTHTFEVSAAGTVVMETMNPGTEHEMINMYHLDGEELVLTHYCAGGNQPTMQMNRETSTAMSLVFDFTGGTNLDPAVDQHIHSAVIAISEEGLRSEWLGYAGGEPAGKMTFHLSRAQ